MTAVEKAMVGFAMVASGAALLVALLAREKPLAPPEDQPVTIAGGSLRMQANPEIAWKGYKKNKKNGEVHYFQYLATHPVSKVEWACDYGDAPTISDRTGAMDISIRYEKGSTVYNTVKYLTDAGGDNLRVQMTNANSVTVGYLLLRSFVEFGEHAKHGWQAVSMTSQNLSPNINCSSISDGEFYLKIHACTVGHGQTCTD